MEVLQNYEAAEEERGTVKSGERDVETHIWPTSQPAVQMSSRLASQPPTVTPNVCFFFTKTPGNNRKVFTNLP